MIIEKFNDKANEIQFDERTGNIKIHQVKNKKFSGIGEKILDNFAILYIANESIYLRLGDNTIEIVTKEMSFDYSHIDTTTTFSIQQRGKIVFKIDYPSWWIAQDQPMPGLGVGDDDENDFFAYIKLMLTNDTRRLHLIKKYS
ncbi:hypothetical protein WH50_14025 [Pokkaliibacter plantistimulans]|uniref:Uncharacterized protein n=1 Tax=Pokkaliibacter plantistimulans TaxID=1635171 RepID=A0ABX5LWL1_9GAMM|nr:hypothetical protein [Pokkaliibacter plantistimulans]PXF30706.1 hypothetical protein WH50_14025 [Pokkaliibacter plantistimulans]